MNAPVAATLPGWYGKLPFLGDFASRRLPPSFVSAWDDWLQQVIYGSRAVLGEQWLEKYLTCPVWHFALAPGICGHNAWFGLMMSSVDRANRHFPFTLAHAVHRDVLRDINPGVLARWLDTLEPEALAQLDLEGSVQQLEERLADYPAPVPDEDTLPPAATDLKSYFNAPRYAARGELASALTATLQDSMVPGASPLSLWWTASTEPQECLAWLCNGLPTSDRYSYMINEAVAS
jgi:type VI secretion system protein ImpM